jgi:hypothetical protein
MQRIGEGKEHDGHELERRVRMVEEELNGERM